jgi:hypothetical protein
MEPPKIRNFMSSQMIRSHSFKGFFFYLVFSALTSLQAFAQQRQLNIQLNWGSPRVSNFSEEESVKYLWFDGAMVSSGDHPMPFYTVQLQVPANVTGMKATFDNEVFIPLSREEKALLSESELLNNPGIIAGITTERFKPKGIVSFYPFRKDASGQWQKLVSCQVQLDYEFHQQQLRAGTRGFTSSSVLAPGTGDWYKIGITKNGVHKISYSFLRQLGIETEGLDPHAINIYGNAFGMLPEANNQFRPDDLAKNSIYIEGEGDDEFNPSDYIIFYAKGPHSWNYNQAGNFFYHSKHGYTDTAYYFLNVNPADISPKRIVSAPSSTLTATHIVSTFDDMAFVEPDLYNFVKSGREWFGDLFDFVTEKSYSFPFSNVDLTQPVRVKCDLAARTPGSASSSFSVAFEGGSGSSSVSLPGVGGGSYPPSCTVATTTFTGTPGSTGDVKLKLTFNKGTSAAQGWLNYIEVFVRRNLVMSGAQMEFRDLVSTGPGKVAEFPLYYSGSGLLIWETTNATEVTQTQTNFSGNTYTFRINSDTLREFVAFSPTAALPTPIAAGRIQNQDLHSLGYADMIIVTAPEFITDAYRLANFHASEGLSVHLVTTREVYNEFSSGMTDATAIKHFLRMFRERAAGDPDLLPKYLLLFGDGSYDNKNRLSGNTAFIPTYQSTYSINVTQSFVSDDYFVMLDDNENMNNTDQLDMGIGRLPVATTEEANDVVNKIIAYSTNSGSLETSTSCCNTVTGNSMGDWRNVYAFVADDEDANAYSGAAEEFADSLKSLHPFINIDKIFLDAYLQQSTPGGERYPDASEDIRSRVQKGCLVLNYIGHGGEVGWAHERILDVSTIKNWTNNPRLPLFMTATCEFSRFDDPARISAGEHVLLNPSGGGIGLLTTTRLVYSGPNETLNKNFNQVVLEYGSDGKPKRIGDIFRETKNMTIAQIASVNTRNFTLLGDPAVRLRLPEYKVVTDSVNGIQIAVMDTLRALSKVTVTGHIEDVNGQPLNSFNGLIFPTVYDKEQTLYTLANDPGSYVMPFDLRKNIIYKGKVSVVNGQFSFSFIVPKDISYDFGIGKLSYYAHNGVTDAKGHSFDIIVGGTNQNAAVDQVPPVVELFLNDENFVFGSITDESPVMIARVNDENGINTVGMGIGHDITAVLDGNTANTIILNDYYEADVNTYQSGMISYPFSNLAEGTHTLKFKVWDVYNNSSEATTEFVVAKSADVALQHVLNYPNPFTTRTQFFFEHNQSCSFLNVQIQVFTVSGKLVKTINENVQTEGYRIVPIEWDGRDDFGDQLAIGTYIYRVKIQTEDGQVKEKFEKLVILH